ncbi:MAG: C40 family peptidase [Actinomycetota bacterium]|nr:C40 family peptidase [Actinomycetota bacterium]
MAFHQAGLGLTHNAYAQYEATKQFAVSNNALQAGDLVFFGPTEAGIHHVGIYVGNNQFIDAPDTGSVVRFDSQVESDSEPELGGIRDPPGPACHQDVLSGR